MSFSPPISAIVPARNEEANIARAVESLAAQPEITEIIVVNDQSTDRTGIILTDLKVQTSNAHAAVQEPVLRVIENQFPPPQGWTGKNWAVTLGAAEARGEWLLFTDADVQHLPGGVSRALADAQRSSVALFSCSPEQEMRTWWERAVIPFIYCRLAGRYSYARINDSSLPDAAANGQFLMIRRDVYNAMGGHQAVSAEVVEDVALARRVKQAGHGICFASGQGIARTRMYSTPGALWEGWKKNLCRLTGDSAGAVLRELLMVIPWIPLAMLLMGGLHALLPLSGLLLLLGRHAGYAVELRRNRFPFSGILYYLPGVLFYSAVLAASAWCYRRGRVTWKGREYPVGTQPARAERASPEH